MPVKKKNGYVEPSFLMIKTLPNLENGIQIAGFISEYMEEEDEEGERKQYSYILYNMKTENILGISKNCDKLFDVSVDHLKHENREFNTTDIFSSSLERLFDSTLA